MKVSLPIFLTVQGILYSSGLKSYTPPKKIIFYSDGIVHVWRPKSQRLIKKYTQPTIKHGGGNVMGWTGFSYSAGCNGLNQCQLILCFIKTKILSTLER